MQISASPRRGSAWPALPWTTERWFNSGPLELADLQGRVVALVAFQMLCPACVGHSVPQATRLARTFGDALTVVGLHAVFEHHEAMTPVSLEAFLHQFRVRFPVGVDSHQGREPITFTRYEMEGTPTTVLIDRAGMVRGQQLGPVDDMLLAASVTRLLDEPEPEF